ncbi:MAG: sensor histidine kinase KdpD [Myxococcales bacterium]|nr:sensor histidine kinase KdpD [Myxococcales bacterium]
MAPTTQADQRPDPDVLLRQVRAEEAKRARAKLKVFFGFAPGVGKTYRMLQAARDLVAEQHVDLVVGLVETHKRYETASLVIGLELLARRKLDYRGIATEEFDLDAALARKPQVILVDELAHTNIPGSRHPKRWQDVMELLDAGIEVHTTLNVQHLESLNDVVAQITGIRVRETVPDAILERADEIALIDVSPQELRARLKDGKVYLGAQADRASEKFFTEGNLLALRELALRQVAHYVDNDVLAFRHQHGARAAWGSSERILVGITPAAHAAKLVRAAKRMAERLRCPWAVAYVDSSAIRPLDDHSRDALEAHFSLAQSLGASIARLTGSDVAKTLLDHARATNVTRMVVGKPQRTTRLGQWRDRIAGSLLEELVAESGEIDIHVITGTAPAPAPRTPTSQPEPRDAIELRRYMMAVGVVSAVTGFAALVRALVPIPDLEMLYFVGVLVAASAWGRGPAMLTAFLSVVAYDFFFVPPVHTFTVADGRYVLTFIMMFGLGLIVSELTSRLRRQEQAAVVREERTARLYATNRELSEVADATAASVVVAHAAAEIFAASVLIIGEGENDEIVDIASYPPNYALAPKERTVAQWSLKQHKLAGLGTDTLNGATVICVPIGDPEHHAFTLVLEPHNRLPLRGEQREFLEAFVRQASIAFDRLRLADEARRAAIAAHTEEMRSAMLSAVSHDLRTPLAAITGAATSLKAEPPLTSATSRELVDAICDQADKMDRLISNLLNMTRLESGGLTLGREWVPLEELIGSALAQIESKLGDRPVNVHIDPKVPFVAVDPVLFEQVFVNLLENATKYAPGASPIEIAATCADQQIIIEVMDRGIGLLPERAQDIFKKFQRGHHPDVAGAGLGLAICRGIVEAHGGTIAAVPRDGGGTSFRIVLPVVSPPSNIALTPTETASTAAGSDGNAAETTR